MNSVISVENLSKAYRIGLEEKRSDTLSGAIVQALKSPLRNFRTIANLNSTSDHDNSLFWALRDVNFEVKQGEVLGIIGHNGAGKSTLLKILSRITEPTEGKITIRGRVSSLLEVGTGFHPDLTGRENIYMNGTILGMTKREIDSKLEEIIEFSGVRKHIDTPVKRYSSGMTVRLAFSVAAHLEPEILIIDEVLAVGDAEFQKKCLGKMKDVSNSGRTVLFVSHNMPVIQSLCSRAILMNRGKISSDGSASQVTKDYLSGFGESGTMQHWTATGRREGKIVFQEIKVMPEDGEFFLMGQPVWCEVLIRSEIEFYPFQLAFKVFDENYNLLTWLFNSDFNVHFDLKPGLNRFRFKMDTSNILPGIYYFTFSALYNYGHQRFDEVEDAIRIDIQPVDIMKSGRPFLKNRGMAWFNLESFSNELIPD